MTAPRRIRRQRAHHMALAAFVYGMAAMGAGAFICRFLTNQP